MLSSTSNRIRSGFITSIPGTGSGSCWRSAASHRPGSFPRENEKLSREGHVKGNVSEPVRAIFIQKKTSQVLRAGVGVTALNRRIVAKNEKDGTAQPTADDVEEFIARTEECAPKVVGCVIMPEVFVTLFKQRYPSVQPTSGVQPFRIGSTEVWLLGSTVASLRGEALLKQEDVFLSLGERIQALVAGSGIPPR